MDGVDGAGTDTAGCGLGVYFRPALAAAAALARSARILAWRSRSSFALSAATRFASAMRAWRARSTRIACRRADSARAAARLAASLCFCALRSAVKATCWPLRLSSSVLAASALAAAVTALFLATIAWFLAWVAAAAAASAAVSAASACRLSSAISPRTAVR